MAELCAMQVLQPQRWSPPSQQLMPPRRHQSRLGPPTAGPVRRPVRPETLERICVTWNKGRCTFPACNFWHICATCKDEGTGPKSGRRRQLSRLISPGLPSQQGGQWWKRDPHRGALIHQSSEADSAAELVLGYRTDMDSISHSV